MLVRISASPDAERGAEYMQRASGQRLPFTLEYGRLTGTVSLFLRFPPQLRPNIETPLVAKYPDIAMQRVGEEAVDRSYRRISEPIAPGHSSLDGCKSDEPSRRSV